MIDFNQGCQSINKFGGSERKITVSLKGELYMVKFPDPIRAKNNPLSYMNNQFSEYIGCKIFESAGIKTQDTILGYYTNDDGKKKIVVGCKDFTQDGSVLYEFSKLANELHQTEEIIKASIEDVYLIIDANNSIIDKVRVKNCFWDVFIIDALIGNSDRHFDNFGITVKDNIIEFAPVYDCGSSLGALLSDEFMKCLIENQTEFKNAEYNTTSCFSYQGKRIFYHEIFKNPPEDLSLAVKRVVPKIDINIINDIISNTPCLPDIRKEYLTRAVNLRYEQIISPAHQHTIKKAAIKEGDAGE